MATPYRKGQVLHSVFAAALFKPSRWGSEQLPLNIAGAYCDFNYQVMYNNSGVICVFTDKRLSLVN
ncbi:MAG: hypothetical protein CMK76_07200 [Pseudomonadales bacterium]|nr:hypothetical protein [Pseudomonadales bacterium]